jgi:hypothetical protein
MSLKLTPTPAGNSFDAPRSASASVFSLAFPSIAFLFSEIRRDLIHNFRMSSNVTTKYLNTFKRHFPSFTSAQALN